MNVAQKTARIAELAMQISAEANKTSALSQSSQRTLEDIIDRRLSGVLKFF